MSTAQCVPAAASMIPLISAVTGALITGVLWLITHALNKRTEYKISKNELIMKSATDNWKAHAEIHIERMKNGKPSELYPLESYIMSSLIFSQEIASKDISEENLSSELSRYKKMTDEVNAFYANQK